MVRYFKPRQDLSYTCMLAPQKIVRNKCYRYDYRDKIYQWVPNYGPPDLELLAQNFIEVKTELEAIEGYS